MRKARKAAREVGPLRFQAHSASREVFQTLIDWKSAQYRRSAKVNIFSYGWPTTVLERIVHETSGAFGGMLSVLHFGDHLAAIALHLRSHTVLHSWFPTYNPAFSKYSPGLILQVELAKLAESLGIRRIDLGKGPERYKRSLASGTLAVAEGSVDVRPTAARLKGCCLQMRHKVLASPLRKPARGVVRAGARLFPPLSHWLSLSRDDSVWKLPQHARTPISSWQTRERGHARTPTKSPVRQLAPGVPQLTEV
jgi:CelD/BcsL family acetyltransferase involved in cellulose biosynthesis